MASYDLVCLDCDHVFEIFVQGFLKDEDRQCPKCGSFKTRQKFSPFLTNATTRRATRRQRRRAALAEVEPPGASRPQLRRT